MQSQEFQVFYSYLPSYFKRSQPDDLFQQGIQRQLQAWMILIVDEFTMYVSLSIDIRNFVIYYLWLIILYFRVHEDHPIMSFTINDAGRLALLNVATQVRQICLLSCGPNYLFCKHIVEKILVHFRKHLKLSCWLLNCQSS